MLLQGHVVHWKGRGDQQSSKQPLLNPSWVFLQLLAFFGWLHGEICPSLSPVGCFTALSFYSLSAVALSCPTAIWLVLFRQLCLSSEIPSLVTYLMKAVRPVCCYVSLPLCKEERYPYVNTGQYSGSCLQATV